jgi:hypothetical protein
MIKFSILDEESNRQDEAINQEKEKQRIKEDKEEKQKEKFDEKDENQEEQSIEKKERKKYKPLPHVVVPIEQKDELLSGKMKFPESPKPQPLPTKSEVVIHVQKSGMNSGIIQAITGNKIQEEISIPLSESPDYTIIQNCPYCNAELKKLKVVTDKIEVRQKIFCKNSRCDFKMEYRFRI